MAFFDPKPYCEAVIDYVKRYAADFSYKKEDVEIMDSILEECHEEYLNKELSDETMGQLASCFGVYLGQIMLECGLSQCGYNWIKEDDCIIDKKRIHHLREKALQYSISYQEFYIAFFDKYLGSEKTQYSAYAKAYAYGFEKVKAVIDEGELIVGKPSEETSLNPEWEHTKEQLFASDRFANVGQYSHMAIDFELLLKQGITGIMSTIEKKLLSEKDREKRNWITLHLYVNECRDIPQHPFMKHCSP